MTDIFHEVDEEVRRDRMMGLWRRYGVYFIVVAVILVGAVAAYEGWQAWQRGQAAADAATFAAAERLARDGKHGEAAAAFQRLAAEGTAGYRALAGLRAAAAQAEAGDRSQAIAQYDRVAADSGVPDLYRQLAQLTAAYHRLDEAEPAELHRRLESLAADGPWRHIARELLALASLRSGDRAGAEKAFAEVADDPAAPAGARARAAELLAALKGPQ